ncbi:MAG: helix-turn-helix transcriptional regulator [Salinivirgaceae bacterium]|nr:helix-turn-helix transcriptional regulator [Salinivirgaceae bacterium]
MDAKDCIIDGAGKLFRKNGLKSVTMDELARSLGMSKRTIYENFKDKDELIQSCLLKFSTDGLARRNKILDTNNNVYEVMYQFAQLQHQELSGVNPVLFDDLRKYYSDLLAKSKSKSLSNNLKLLERLFKTGIDGQFFNSSSFNVEVASRLIYNSIEFAIDLIDNHKYAPYEVYRTIFYPFFRGISTEKGIGELDKVNERMCGHKK